LPSAVAQQQPQLPYITTAAAPDAACAWQQQEQQTRVRGSAMVIGNWQLLGTEDHGEFESSSKEIVSRAMYSLLEGHVWC
jgi:hypothetical protein